MKNKKLIILIILSICAVISLIYGITASPRGRRKALSGSKSPESAQPASKVVPIKRRARKTRFAMWGRSPFVPGVTSGISLTLGGIMWNEENPKAMIGGKTVEIGEKIGENKVVDIKKDRVILNDGTEDFVLKLEY